MRRIPIDEIRDGDILARDIFSSSGVSLIAEGTVLKKNYINRLADLHIKNVFIKEKNVKEPDITTGMIIEEELREQCATTIKNALEKYSYAETDEMKEVVSVANDIMTNILNEPNIMYNVSCVREKGKELYLHSLNVAALSALISLRTGYSNEKVKEIAIGALLHDIGFTSISFDTTELIFDECDANVKKELMRHVIYGYAEVEKKEWLSKTVKDIVVQHHERIDGSGYPMHLKEASIVPEVRIVSLCDQFDSMVYGRLSKKYKVRDAMDYIMSQAGVQFDFELVQTFFESVAAYPIGTTVVTSDGDTAVVIRQNYKFPTRPVIRLLKNSDGEEYAKQEERDLTKNLTLFITDSVEE